MRSITQHVLGSILSTLPMTERPCSCSMTTERLQGAGWHDSKGEREDAGRDAEESEPDTG
jgi:hypothetical protein